MLVTETSDLAADLIVLGCRKRAVPFFRFNQDQYPMESSISWDGDGQGAEIIAGQRSISTAEIRSAWFRRAPEPITDGSGRARFTARETSGFLDCFWEAFSSYHWVNRPSAVRAAERKPLQLLAAQRVGFKVPKTRITNDPDRAREFVSCQPSIMKAVVGGLVEECGHRFALFTQPISRSDLRSSQSIQASPFILQERLKNLFDVRATVVGTKIFSARIEIDNKRDDEVDWRSIDPKRLRYERYQLPDDIADACGRLLNEFSLRFAALDLIVTPAGDHVFLEINPSGQWGWIEGATGHRITDAIIDELTWDES